MAVAPLIREELKRFHNALADQVLEPGNSYYIAEVNHRGGADVIEEIATEIDWQQGGGVCLFTGQRGTGKSTELMRLKKQLEGGLSALSPRHTLSRAVPFARRDRAPARVRSMTTRHDGAWHGPPLLDWGRMAGIATPGRACLLNLSSAWFRVEGECQTQLEMAGLQQSRNVGLGSAGQPERRCCAAST